MDTLTLLARGYLPKEVPTPFITEPFSTIVHIHDVTALTPTPGQKRLITRPATHNLARPGGQRRKLHIPNPFSYWKLCRVLEDKWATVERHYQKTAFSRSKPIADPSEIRALRTEFEGDQLPLFRAENRRVARYVLRTDISRFYDSIYTHGIEWALDGKANVKAKITTRTAKAYPSFGKSLDTHVRELQELQSLGIPIGPDASLVLAEIIACAIDELLIDRGLRGFRFMDDYEIAFQSRAEAESGLVFLEQALDEFELAINPRKTSIDELPVELDNAWRTRIKGYYFPNESSITDTQLIHYFNSIFELKTKYPHAAVLAYAIRRLSSCTVENWELLQNLIFQCVLKEAGAIDAMISLLETQKERGISDDIDELVSRILDHNVPLNHGSELAWAVWSAIWFQRHIPKEPAEKLDGNPDPIVALLTLHARDIGVIESDVEFPIWSSRMTADALYNDQWLLAYEADFRGWLPSAESANHVNNDTNFSKLKSLGISFFDPHVSAPTRALLKAAYTDSYGVSAVLVDDF